MDFDASIVTAEVNSNTLLPSDSNFSKKNQESCSSANEPLHVYENIVYIDDFGGDDTFFVNAEDSHDHLLLSEDQTSPRIISLGNYSDSETYPYKSLGDSPSQYIAAEAILEEDPSDCNHCLNSYLEDSVRYNSTDRDCQDNIDMGVENTWSQDFPITSSQSMAGIAPSADMQEGNAYGDFSGCDILENVQPAPYSSDLDVLFSNTPNMDVDVKGSMSEAGACGLRNLGNTCFMSAGLQCLAATKSVAQFFTDTEKISHLEMSSLTAQFAQLMQKIWSGEFSIIHPADFKQALGLYYPQFKDCSQHDCQEFLALLLDALHQQLIGTINVVPGSPPSFNAVPTYGPTLNLVPEGAVDGDFRAKSGDSVSTSESGNSTSTEPCMATLLGREDSPDCPVVDEGTATGVANSPGGVANDENYDVSRDEGSLKSPIWNNERDYSPFSPPPPPPAVVKKYPESVQKAIIGLKKEGEQGTEMDLVDEGKWKAIDIMKDTKTSNVNILAAQDSSGWTDVKGKNGGIHYASDKYTNNKKDRRRRDKNVYDENGKNNNSKNCINNKMEMEHEGKVPEQQTEFLPDYTNASSELSKRIKVNVLSEKNTIRARNDLDYRERLDRPFLKLEKNERMEKERMKDDEKIGNLDKALMQSSSASSVPLPAKEEAMEVGTPSPQYEKGDECRMSVSSEIDSADDVEGDKHWQKHTEENKSVILDSFQGQFKNTVVCSTCKFKSVTYEPFVYLSVPLPHAIEKQICVTFVPANGNPAVKYLVTPTKQDNVSKIKEQLTTLLGEATKYPIVIGEVFDYHISRILDDNHQVRYLDDTNRLIYAFEQLVANPPENESEIPCQSEGKGQIYGCTICMEEKDTGIKMHKDCLCVMCDSCVVSFFQHTNSHQCPICRKDLESEADFVSVNTTDMRKNIRMINVPIVYRIDSTGDGNNNQKSLKLFGHPALLKLPNQMAGSDLYAAVSSVQRYTRQPFKLLFVNGQGTNCSRCMYNAHCYGCEVEKEEFISLKMDDTLAISYGEEPQGEGPMDVNHASMKMWRENSTLSLYDCVQAFSQSEILDEYNPWYCPRCEKNQCATKTLSIWRFPNYLIVYLKRFIFHECASMKLEDKVVFPLHDFHFNSKVDSTYDLYACVCHSGGVSVGHYVAYTQHPRTNEWHCFNDETVSKREPQEEEYCDAYILFYKKRGNCDVEMEPTAA